MFTNENRIWNVAIESYKREQDLREIVALYADATLKAAKVLLQFLFEYIRLKITYKFNFVFKYLHSCHTVADKKLNMHFLAKCQVSNSHKYFKTENDRGRKCLKYAGEIAGSTAVMLTK